ncbi:MAG: flagellar filament capping protein FliD [Gemmatimonadetes bacterium]|nr:flagellar filament capping protein FliD [Gemmatimonadota bacterium]MBK7924983.1 flagellar filament capping protein FliD [Gemmatimonadota bacterium]MBK9693078.1 flagellar filament capping protein FliD [Gemmatimonadota bacterium]MBP9201111.1 flagellar filament capping protein FliD [Gemmatimonadales bacterium]
MATSSSSVSGLVSGIDYRSLVDQIITNEGVGATRLRDQEKKLQAQLTALGKYKELVTALQTATKALQDGSAFDAVSATTAALSGTRTVVSATGSRTAAPGVYRVGVTALAKAQKLGSGWTASPSTALGLTAGSFTVNGATITVDANDTLTSIRDKFNAANSGTGASKVTASILQVSATNYRLVLTSDETGVAGMTLTDVSGGVPQALGFTNGSNQILGSALLVAGADAQFTVDGIAMTRSSNTVTDAIQGVTLSLTAEEAGAVTSVSIERSFDGAQKAVQAFADAWNKLVDFTKEQRTPPKEGVAAPTLYNESLLRTISASLARTLLTGVPGAQADLATAGMAGLSIGQDGKLTLNATKLETAFKGRLNDLRTLFSQVGTATDARVSYVSSGSDTQPGTYAVDITQAATQALLLGTGFSGTYADDGTADTLTVTEKGSGAAVSIQLTNGMTTAQIASALTSAFGASVKHKVATGTVLYGDAAGTVPMTGTTKFSELRSAGGGTFGVVDGQTIAFSGKRGDGTTFAGTFSITSASSLTVGDLVTQVQAAYGSGAAVSVSGGQIVVEDGQGRTSQLALTLTPGNEGGGTLDFGATTTLATGRPILSLAASDVGGQLQVNATAWGSSPGFTLAYTAGGADGTAQLGLAAGTYSGLDVTGTIGGYAATGAGRTLVGGDGTAVEGLTLSYTGTATGAAGSVSVTLGTAAQLQRALDSWLEANAGTMAKKEASLTGRVKTLEDKALLIDARLDRRRESLLKQFAQMETAIARLQQTSSSVTAMLQSFSKSSS